MLKKVVRALKQIGGIQPPTDGPLGFDERHLEIFEAVRPFTMTSRERVTALCEAVEYVVRHQVPGDIVECGVWKGGSMMAIAKTLNQVGERRKLHLFDTFEGMSEPTEADKDFRGNSAAEQLETQDRDSTVWAFSPLEEVRQNLGRVGYDSEWMSFVQGKVEETIPEHAPETISLLRLDTDWFESTYHELTHLFPRLSVGGILIIDDYGHWQGARKAVDQYFKENGTKVFLTRVDYTGRLCVKLEN